MKTIATVLFASLVSFAACKDEKKAAPTPAPATAPKQGPTAEMPKLPEAPTAPTGNATGSAAAPVDPLAGLASRGPMTVDEAGAKAVAVMTKFAAAVKDAKGDCATMGENLNGMKSEMTALMKAGQAFEKDPEKKAAFDEKFAAQLKPLMTSVVGDLAKCKDDTAVAGFMTSMRNSK